MKKHVELGPRLRILQIGLRGQGEIHHFSCGIRYGIDPLAGVMAAQGMLKWGQVRWASACGEALPFPSGNFQVILLSDILGSVESPERVLDEASRCLRSDGVLIVSLPSRWDGELKSRLLRGGNRRIKPLRRVNRARTLKWCQQTGFEAVWSGNALETPAEHSTGSTNTKYHMAAPCLILQPLQKPVAAVSSECDASPAAFSTARQITD